jgi:hypothetical protein
MSPAGRLFAADWQESGEFESWRRSVEELSIRI